MQLEESSAQHLTINTSTGPYQYTVTIWSVVGSSNFLEGNGYDSPKCWWGHLLYWQYSCDLSYGWTTFGEARGSTEGIEDDGLRMKREKCVFFQNSVEYLGYPFEVAGLHTLPSKVKAIVQAPEPENLQQSLGIIEVLLKVCPKSGNDTSPLELVAQAWCTVEMNFWMCWCFQASQVSTCIISSISSLQPEVVE